MGFLKKKQIMIKGGKNMSKGREWIPVLRRNKTMMMRVNVEPVINGS